MKYAHDEIDPRPLRPPVDASNRSERRSRELPSVDWFLEAVIAFSLTLAVVMGCYTAALLLA